MAKAKGFFADAIKDRTSAVKDDQEAAQTTIEAAQVTIIFLFLSSFFFSRHSLLCSLSSLERSALTVDGVQRYLAHKRQPPPRTLQ